MRVSGSGGDTPRTLPPIDWQGLSALAELKQPRAKKKNSKPKKPQSNTQNISRRRRFEILERDKFRCTYCGRSAKENGVVLHVDHIHPKSKGGSNDPENLPTACKDCNYGKATKILYS